MDPIGRIFLLRRSGIPTLGEMEMICAECGCVVDRGIRLAICHAPECCCRQLPVRRRAGGVVSTKSDEIRVKPSGFVAFPLPFRRD